jgi:hypothetical protein
MPFVQLDDTAMLLGFLESAKPTDFKQAIGLALLACSKGGPLYDPVALLLTLAMDEAGPRPVTNEYAQLLLNSAPSGMKAPATKAALLIVTDVSLRSNDGTADTDDRFMLLLVCYFLARVATIGNLHSLTVLLSARKKGPEGKKDTTTPADVAAWMRGLIVKFGPVVGPDVGTDVDKDESSFSVNGIDVRIFQQQSQTTPCESHELDAGSLAAPSAQLEELRYANAPFLSLLESTVRDAVPIHFALCGPIDVATALLLVQSNARGYAISADSGVNSGQPGSGVTFRQQRSNRGSLVLLALAALAKGSVVNVGPSVTRTLVTPPAILGLVTTYDDPAGVMFAALNAFKVGGSPVIPAVPLGKDGTTIDKDQSRSACAFAWRITVESNVTSFLGSEALKTMLARASEPTDIQLHFQYSTWLALTMVANFLLAHSAPIEPSVLAECIASPSSIASVVSAIPMPPTLAAAIGGITTVAGMYKLIALCMDARLSALAEVWGLIAHLPAISELKISGPVVSTAAPIITPSGSLALAQPF